MEKKHKDILQSSHCFLLENICNVASICDYLQQHSILNLGQVETIMVETRTPRAQVREMLDNLRGPTAYEYFVAALIETKNTTSSDFLRAKEDCRSSQNSAQPKPKDVCEKGDNSKKSEGPPQNIHDEDKSEVQGNEDVKKKEVCGWPDLKNAGNRFKKKEIQMSTPEFHSTKMTGGQQIYHMSCTGVKRGKVIWISNTHCPTEEKLSSCRYHIDFDQTNMTLLLKEIGFDSKDQIKNKTTEEIKQLLTDRLAEVDNDKDVHHDSLIVVMMSGKVGCTSGEIYDKDGNIVPMNEILQILKDSQYFKGKPKIVIIQTYNFQESTFFDETDSGNEMKVLGEPNPDDLFVVSSYPRIKQGPWMIGEYMNGSYFIQALIHILKNHTHDKSFLELMKEVHKCLLNVDIPEKDKDGKYKKKHVADVVLLEHSQEKELYFFPGIKVAKPE